MTDRPCGRPAPNARKLQSPPIHGALNHRFGLALASAMRTSSPFPSTQPESFWTELWDFCAVKAETRGDRVLIDGDKMPGGRFFPDARLNYAENLLVKNDDTPALIFRGEDKVQPAHELARAQRRRRPNAARLDGSRHQGGRPGLRRGAQHAGNHCGLPRGGLARRHLVVLFARFRRARHSRPLRPDRAQAACSPAMAITMPARPSRLADKIAKVLHELPSVEHTVVIDYTGEAAARWPRRCPTAKTLDEFHGSAQATAPITFAPAALRSSALYSLFVGHHRHSQMHRPPRRRNSAEAS